MKNCTKHFWREKARAPVNVCPFRNRLFCIRSDIHCEYFLLKIFSFYTYKNHWHVFIMTVFTVYIRAYAEQTVTERTDVYRSTRFFAPKIFCTVFHPKLYASNVLLYRPCMSIYYLPKHHNFRHGSLVV